MLKLQDGFVGGVDGRFDWVDDVDLDVAAGGADEGEFVVGGEVGRLVGDGEGGDAVEDYLVGGDGGDGF